MSLVLKVFLQFVLRLSFYRYFSLIVSMNETAYCLMALIWIMKDEKRARFSVLL